MNGHSVAIFSGILAGSAGFAMAQDVDIDSCFENEDTACLEAFFADIVTNKTPEKSRAIFLLGKLQEQAGAFETAQDTYMMSASFGGGDAPNNALQALFVSQPQVFDEAAECFQIENDQCFEEIIQNGTDENSMNSKFLFGSLLLGRPTDAERGLLLLEDAANSGHGTAPCLLQETYESSAQDVASNYDKFVTFGRQCGFDDPIPQIDDGHFAKYEKKQENKAYAIDERGVAFFGDGVSSPEVAARLALEFCNKSPHRRSETPDCEVVNINGLWVDNPETEALPVGASGVDELILLSAQESYRDDYAQEDSPKVFVQSRNGAWRWQSKGNSDLTIEELTERALEKCESGWRFRLEYPCEVVNLNGEWAN